MSSYTQPASKPHYPILDGLRGVAALTVVIFHTFEAHATSRLNQIVNHGYLAVDFFFLLSGFVIGYAYDDRWQKLTLGGFFKRRLARLQPMVVMGMIVGAALFYFQDGPAFPGIHQVPVWQMLLVMLVGFTLIPLPISADIRGWQEMHPLNGPGWSLFFEYLANIMYALFVRKFSKTALTILVAISGAALIHYTVTGKTGDVIGGWSLNAEQLRIGFTRLMFPFFGGLLLSRTVKVSHISNAFLWCSLLLLATLVMPRIGGADHLWANGLYESLVIIIAFPFIVYLGASGQVEGKFSSKLCKFLGDISYPIYITHYPIIYTYTAWVSRNRGMSFQTAFPWAALTIISSVVLAYACLKLYDEPVRRWLHKKLIS
ncbi:acyltransferase family protein [Mucilaginibacter lacusdianchii]|uniref:acyltransferase family protein n=1 Tax=Mucilaginibacter lacusdianchii TaxID=2684211 RepID=UPI00131B74B5|nr:acyltransferase [Mucilaginibacter sp. JXJ CY 39]